MRIRQIKPSFWSDTRLADLPAPVRLTYIGLWMIADDGGWFRWEPAQVANELYGYEPRHEREQAVVEQVGLLVGSGRVVIHDCGHAQVPHLVDHQRVGDTKRVLTVQREHGFCRGVTPINPITNTSPGIPGDSDALRQVPGTVSNGRVRVSNGTVSNGTGKRRTNAPTKNDDDLTPVTSEFTAKVPRPR